MDIFRSVPERENSRYKGTEAKVCFPYSRNGKETSVPRSKLQEKAAKEQPGWLYWRSGDLSFYFVRQDTIGEFSAEESYDLSL